MLSAFGVDHGEIYKAFGGSILGQAIKVDHGVGAGAMTARNLAGGRTPKSISSVEHMGARANAKKQGQKAAKQFRQLGTPKGYGGYESAHPGIESANTGWASRANSIKAINRPSGKTPVGMRGPVTSRTKTTKMRQNERNFL